MFYLNRSRHFIVLLKGPINLLSAY